ncbi:MAG TPA: transporter [Dongiaceae bacterium]|nr:transporter [Dongiaceae bacterium]
MQQESPSLIRRALLGRIVAIFALSLFLMPSAYAQLGGEQIRGDLGLKSGSQAPPGLYVAQTLYFYRPTEVTGQNGAPFPGDISLNLFAPVLGANYVSKKKIFGAHYGAAAAMWIMNQKLALPSLNVDNSNYGFGDMYFSPLQLGWNFKHADMFASYAFYAPTGRYTAGASDNTGLGMWTNEFGWGTTVYFDEAKMWHMAGTALYEFHTKKQGVDQTVGGIMTIEGGVGRSFLKGYASAGAAYYGQWKVTPDSGTDVSPLVAGLKGSIVGFGPELDMPVCKCPVLMTFRYLFDVDSRVATKGNTLYVSFVWVHPSKP